MILSRHYYFMLFTGCHYYYYVFCSCWWLHNMPLYATLFRCCRLLLLIIFHFSLIWDQDILPSNAMIIRPRYSYYYLFAMMPTLLSTIYPICLMPLFDIAVTYVIIRWRILLISLRCHLHFWRWYYYAITLISAQPREKEKEPAKREAKEADPGWRKEIAAEVPGEAQAAVRRECDVMKSAERVLRRRAGRGALYVCLWERVYLAILKHVFRLFFAAFMPCCCSASAIEARATLLFAGCSPYFHLAITSFTPRRAAHYLPSTPSLSLSISSFSSPLLMSAIKARALYADATMLTI